MQDDLADDAATPADLSPEARRRAARDARRGKGSPALPRVRAIAVLRYVWTGAWNDGFIHAGNLAYMSLLALFPFLLVVTAILAALGEPSQRDASIDALMTALPPMVAKVLRPVAHEVVTARSGALLWIGGAVGLWTTSSLLETIRDILHRAYGTPLTKAFWRYRLVSAGVVSLSVVLLLLSLFVQVAITAAQEVVSAWFPRLETLLDSLTTSRLIGSAVLYLSVFLLFITLTPDRYRGKTYPKWPGALLVTAWWVAVVLLLPVTLRAFFSYDLTYGSLAGVMIALFFFWLVGLGIVVGAELNAALVVSPEERALRRRDGAGG